MNKHEFYMRRCLALAQKGIGTARPNPSVGAVVVWNEKIIGEGYTSSYGGNHAEVNAIHSVKNKEHLKEAIIYVTLEPCSHFGKTPPCADLIVKHKIPNVVIGCVDTNSKVSGKGIARLRNAGCNVTIGVLEKECKAQHRRFFTVQNKKRSYVILKWAQTSDGFIAPEKKEKKRPVWISSPSALQLVHKWRSEEHAILVGTNTAIDDNPKLDVRNWKGNNPVRIVLDKHLRIPKENSLFEGVVQTVALFDSQTKKSPVSKNNLLYKEVDFSKNSVAEIMRVLYEMDIQSVIIEGGKQTLQTFINENIWDEARVFEGNVAFFSGTKAPKLEGALVESLMVGETKLKMYKNPNLDV